MSALFAVAATVASLSLPATSLAGTPRVFPRDASRPRAVYVVTFSKAATGQASEWTRALRSRKDVLPSALFQVAVLEEVPRILRSLVISSMKADIPQNLHDHFWIVTSAGRTWQDLAHASAMNEAYVLVLDHGDSIVWRSHGAPSALKLAELGNLPAPSP